MTLSKSIHERPKLPSGFDWKHISNISSEAAKTFVPTENKGLGFPMSGGQYDTKARLLGQEGVYELVQTPI